jgi:hypothetical protein
MIDLSQYIGKKVAVYFDGSLPRTGIIEKKSVGRHCYSFGRFLYDREGHELANSHYNIIEIREIRETTMASELEKQLKLTSDRNRIQLFSFGSNTAKLSTLVEHFQHLMDQGWEELEISTPKGVEVGELAFFSVRSRMETAQEYLTRMGLDTKDKQWAALEALRGVLNQ